MDGALDADDCEPEDAGIFPGALDECDGADMDCNPGFCTLDIAGQTVVDIAVSTGNRVGFTTDAPAAAGFFHTFDGTTPATGVAFTNATLTDPLGLALNPAYLHNASTIDFFYVVEGLDGSLRPYSSTSGAPGVPAFTGAGAGGAVAMSPFGEMILVGLDAANALGALDPCEDPMTPSDCWEDSGSTLSLNPVGIDLVTSSTVAPNPGLGLDSTWRLRDIALRPDTLIDGAPTTYLIFDGQPALVVVRIAAATLVADPASSGSVTTPPMAPATSVAYDVTSDLVLVTAGDGVTDGALLVYAAGGSAAATTLASTTLVPGGAVPSCPGAAALGSDGTTLRVADACNDAVWNGTVSAGGATVTLDSSVATCAAPTRLAVVPAAPDLVYIGCTGALGVLGSD
jgi:hypothetical protein